MTSSLSFKIVSVRAKYGINCDSSRGLRVSTDCKVYSFLIFLYLSIMLVGVLAFLAQVDQENKI